MSYIIGVRLFINQIFGTYGLKEDSNRSPLANLGDSNDNLLKKTQIVTFYMYQN